MTELELRVPRAGDGLGGGEGGLAETAAEACTPSSAEKRLAGTASTYLLGWTRIRPDTNTDQSFSAGFLSDSSSRK